MASLAWTWGQGKLAATLYDLAVQNPRARRWGGWTLWGAYTRRMVSWMELLASTPAGSTVLDVPCGGGLLFGALPHPHLVHYTALDFSKIMLGRAQQRMIQLNQSDIHFQQGDVGNLPYKTGQFNLLVSFNGLHCFPDPAQAIAEMARVTAPQGHVRGSCILKGSGLRYDLLIKVFQHRGYFGPTCTLAELQDWLDQAGMDILRLETTGAMILFEAVRRPN